MPLSDPQMSRDEIQLMIEMAAVQGPAGPAGPRGRDGTGNLIAPDGSRWKITVDENGQLGTEVVTAFIPEITVQPVDVAARPTSESGAGAEMFIVASGGTDPLTFVWQHSTDNGATWIDGTQGGFGNVDQSGNTYTISTPSMYISTGMNNWLIRCVVTNSLGSTASESARLVVGEPVVITQQPQSQSRPYGTSPVNPPHNMSEQFTMSVEATGDPAPTYSWELSYDDGNTWSPIYPIVNTNQLTQNVSTEDTLSFRVTVTNPFGTVVSDAATMNVTSVPIITNQPVDTTRPVGYSSDIINPISFIANPKPVQVWQVSKDNGATWTDSTMDAGSTYPFASQMMRPGQPLTADDTGQYRLVLTNSEGVTTSDVMTLTVS